MQGPGHRDRHKGAEMTEELFRDDAHAPACEATVAPPAVAAAAGGPAEAVVVLARPVFSARAGGQPGARGRLRLAGGGRLVEVIDPRRDAESGRILHIL